MLISKPILQLYDVKKSVICLLMLSKTIRSCSKQIDENGILHPITYHSKTFKSYEVNCAITELEYLATAENLDKFNHYLHGQKFTIHTNHTALLCLQNVKNKTKQC